MDIIISGAFCFDVLPSAEDFGEMEICCIVLDLIKACSDINK